MTLATLKKIYKKHERWVPIAFFALGFLFDAIMVQRLDKLLTILHQALYLAISAAIISIELLEMSREVNPPAFLKKIWGYREALLHFLLGTLLNVYTIFYFKSASAFTPYLFIAILITLLILNEFKRFGKSQAQVHMAFLTLCLVSYLVTLAPILIGFMGTIPFLSGIFATVLVFSGFYRILKSLLPAHPQILRTHVRLPFISILGIFVLLYFFHAIPPAPLSVKFMGIYHNVEKQDDQYRLTYTRSQLKFWQHGDQTFLARPGDSLYCFVRVFSPTHFNDQIQLRWLFHDDTRGWVTADVIPLPITGGREAGYRGMAVKNNYQPGEWRVQVETSDNREIGRIRFNIVSDESTDTRDAKVEIH